jgi:hypothetical protein
LAVKNFYLTDAEYLSETAPGAETYLQSGLGQPVGWVVSTGAGPDYSLYFAFAERAASTFGATALPASGLDTANHDFLTPDNITDLALTGSFVAGNWVFRLPVRAQTNGGAHDGNAQFRLYRVANTNGGSAVELTSAIAVGSTVTNLATSATQTSSVTVALGAISLSNELLCLQVAWKRTGAGGMTSSDVNIRAHNTVALITTPDFSGALALTPSLFTNAATFFAATVTAGAVGLSPSLYTDADTFFTPTVVNATPLTQSARFDDADSFFAPTVAPGAVGLTPSLYTDSDSFFSATVGRGAVGLAPSLFTDADTFFSATVAAGGAEQALVASLYQDADTFFGPTVAGTYALTPSLFTNAAAFYAPTVAQAATQALTPNRFDSSATFYLHAVAGGSVPDVASSYAGAKRSWGGVDPLSVRIMTGEDEVRRILDHYEEIAKLREPKKPPPILAKRKPLVAALAPPVPALAFAPARAPAITRRPVKVTLATLRQHDTAPAVEAAREERRHRRNEQVKRLIATLVANDEI